MVASVGFSSILGTTGGAAIGYLFGGPAGASTGAQFGASIGIKVGCWICGAKLINNIGERTAKTLISTIDSGAKFIFTTGLLSFAYWGTSVNVQKSCTINPQHQTCQIFPYINFGLLIFSTAAITYTIASSVLNLFPYGTPKQKEQLSPNEVYSYSNPLCATTTTRDPYSCKVTYA